MHEIIVEEKKEEKWEKKKMSSQITLLQHPVLFAAPNTEKERVAI